MRREIEQLSEGNASRRARYDHLMEHCAKLREALAAQALAMGDAQRINFTVTECRREFDAIQAVKSPNDTARAPAFNACFMSSLSVSFNDTC